MARRKLVIVGASLVAEVACEYFDHDSPFEVAAFAVEDAHRTRDELLGRPVVSYEGLTATHPPSDYAAFVAVNGAGLNRLRARFHGDLRAKSYTLASYVSSRAFVWRNVTIGDNCFILEHNVIQPFVRIGDDVTLWSGNHIGHHSTIGDHCFITSHVVVSGRVTVGPYCFVGVNATFADDITVGADNFIGAGALITRDTAAGALHAEKATPASPVSAPDFCKVPADSRVQQP